MAYYHIGGQFAIPHTKKQGGWQLEQNPYASRIERFENGLFIQVGEMPESCLTPEGGIMIGGIPQTQNRYAA